MKATARALVKWRSSGGRGLFYINRRAGAALTLLGKKMAWSLWAGLGYILPFVNLHFNWDLLGGALY